MADKNDATIVDEVEQRLEDLFGDDEETSDIEADAESREEQVEEDPLVLKKDEDDVIDAPVLEMEEGVEDFEDSPLKDLKSIVLSIEWEITDKIMAKFLDQAARLSKTYQNEKIVLMFLQLLGSVGRYIKAKKDSADPDVVRLLNSAYAGLEKVVLKKDLSEAEKKKILAAEVNKFKEIKERLSGKKTPQKTAAAEPKPVVEPKPAAKPTPEPAPVKREPERVSVETETLPEKEAVAAVAAPRRRKGVRVGSRIALMVLLPLTLVASALYLYVNRLTNLPSQLDQIIQNLSGLPAESASGIVVSVLCGLIVCIGLIAFWYGNRLGRKIKDLSESLERIAAGNT